MYSYACRHMNVAPRMTVSSMPWMTCARLPSRSAWCAQVSVTPEVSSSAVLMVGIGHGPIVVNGGTVPAGPAFGHSALKSGHSSLLFRSPSHGMAMVRA